MPPLITLPFVATWRRRRTIDDTFEAQALSCIDNLYGISVRLARTPGEAEDLVYETYAQAFWHAAPPRGKTLKFWLFTILYSRIRHARRNIALDPTELDTDCNAPYGMPTPSDRGDGPEQMVTEMVSDADLEAALDSLPDSLWQVIWLRDFEDFSYAEIAQMLAIPIATVRSYIGRARCLLYERLAADRNPSVIGPI